VLRRVVGPKSDKVTGEWRKLHNEKKKDAMGGACGTCWRNESCVHGFGGGNLRERDHLHYLGVDGMTILN